MKSESGLSGILVGLLYFILGIVFLAVTDELIKTFNYVLVSICLVLGVIQLIQFFVNKKYKNDNYTDLFMAVIFIWVSLILYVFYGFMINILPILFSLYLFIMASDMMIRYLQMKDVVGINRKKYLILFAIALVIGLLLIFNPGGVIITYLKVTGIYLVVVSVLYFIDYFKMFKR